MKTFLQLNTVFISMVMEAIPFILIGAIISGLIQAFVSDRIIARIMPNNRFLATLLGCFIGLFFPACECGIVPITKRLLYKGVPLPAAISFMLTGPIINPIVLYATFIAFGNTWQMALIRAGSAVVVATVVALALSYMFKTVPLKEGTYPVEAAAASDVAVVVKPRKAWYLRVYEVMVHAIEEFFASGKFLVLGAFIAASMQIFIPTSTLLHWGGNPVTASLIMIALAFVMSLCSEADAFIASSFRTTFSVGPLSAFLVFGPMIDIKNTLMLLGVFRTKFVAALIALTVICTLSISLVVEGVFG
ncbi:permease [Paenibacillus kobensis]|uniref:permease n=1 Tax=Paenibacillus kobensis TaxID=59841 RepID=UPI000FDC15F9|nr:permease [Paenibacillus kobensis]